MAKLSAILALLFVGTASAFAPASFGSHARSVVVDASRRDMLGQAAGVVGLVAAGAAPAFADGAVSMATVQRARGIYGGRIADLTDAVEKGDTAAIMAEKNAFALFVSGGYKMSTKEDQVAIKKASDAVLAAASAGDKAATKSAYKEFMSLANIQAPYSGKDKDYSQGYSSDYDWKTRTSKGTIYVR